MACLLSRTASRAPTTTSFTTTVPGFLALCLALSLIGGVVGVAEAQSDGADQVEGADVDESFDRDLDQWIFSTGLEVGIMGYNPKASMRGSLIDPSAPIATNLTPQDDGPETIIRSNSDRTEVISGLVGANFEIMAPRMTESPFIPRFFLDLNVSAVLTSEVPVVRRGRPEPNNFSIPELSFNFGLVGSELVVGTGEEVTAQEQGPAVFVGLGGAWTFDFEGGGRLRVKPSLVYTRTRVEVFGIAARAIRLVNTTTESLSDYRFIVLREDFSEVYHGLGPAIELELDTDNQIGPFEISLFLKGHANHIFGDLDTDLLQANPEFPSEFVRWRYEQERWTFRASTGIRFRLVGND